MNLSTSALLDWAKESEIGTNHTAKLPKSEAMEAIRTAEDLDGSFDFVAIDDTTTLVVRVEDKGLSAEKVMTALKTMNPFEPLTLMGNVQYIRNIVSKCSRETGRKFSVKQLPTHDGVTIREDWQSRTYFNSGERWNWIEFVASMGDVMNASKIKDEEAAADNPETAPAGEPTPKVDASTEMKVVGPNSDESAESSTEDDEIID